MPNAMFFLPFSNRRQKMKRKRWERNWKLLISHFSLIISFGLWGIKTRHFQTVLKKGFKSLIDNSLNNFFLCRRHYIQLIFKWSQLPLLSLRSNAPLTIQGRKRHCLYVFSLSLATDDTKQKERTLYFITQVDMMKTFGPPFLHQPALILKTHFFIRDFRSCKDQSVTFILQACLFNFKWHSQAAPADLCLKRFSLLLQQPRCLQLSRLSALHVFCLPWVCDRALHHLLSPRLLEEFF